MYLILPLTILLLACGDIPKEGSEKVQVRMQLTYPTDNGTDNESKRHTE